MANIIKNGSFETGKSNSNGTRFVPTHWVVPNTYYSTMVSQSCDDNPDNITSIQLTCANWNEWDDNGFPEGIPSISVQQGIDLTEYKKEVTLNIEFNYSLAYDHCLTRSGQLDVYLYRATEYDLDENSYEYEGSYLDYLSYQTFSMSRPELTGMSWKASHFIVTGLTPGYYILVFATPIAEDTKTGKADASYSFVLDKVSGTVEETGREVVQYHNILKNGSFESGNNSGLEDWHSEEISVKVTSSSPYENDANNSHGEYVCEVSCENLELAKRDKYGLKQVFKIDSYCRTKVSLDFQQYRNYSFALSVYKLNVYYEYDKENPAPPDATLPFYYLTDFTPYYQTDIKAIAQSSTTYSYWEEFSDTFSIEPGYYILIIHPGERTTVIDNVKVNIFTEQETGNDGSFDNPFTSEDGYISPDKKCFYFYDANTEIKTGFIFYNENYYYCKSEVLVQNEICSGKYFHPDGKMARFESFTYNGNVYVADMQGNIHLESDYVLNVVPFLDEKMVYGPIESLDIVVGKSQNLYVKYVKQNPESIVKVDSSNTSVVTCTGTNAGLERDMIELTGKSVGTATITLSVPNDEDDTIISRKVNVIVLPDVPKYTKPNDMYFRKSAVCMTPGETMKLGYTVLPREAMAMAVYWFSSDASVAIVDQNGNITANGVGDCKITIYNHRLNLACHCEVYVVEKFSTPSKITWKTSPPKSIQVDQEIRLPDCVLSNLNGYYNTMKQDGYWISSNPSVIKITEYGTMIGVSVGEAYITFLTSQNFDLSSSAKIEVNVPYIPIEDIKLDVYEATLYEAAPYGRFTINHKVVPANTTQPEVVWTSSNTELATVNTEGLVEIKKKVDEVRTVTIRCASASNESLYKECDITLDPFSNYYAHVIKTFTPTITTSVNRAVNIEYEVVRCFSVNFSALYTYHANVVMESGSSVSRDSYSIEHNEGSMIKFSASVKGRYRITLTCNMTRTDISYQNAVTYATTTFIVEVGQSENLVFVENLETVSALGNGSYILKFFIRDNRDNVLYFELDTGNGIWKPVTVDNLMYQGKMYNYIFGDNLPLGTHLIRVRATEVDTGSSEISNVATVVITAPTSDKKNALYDAKIGYDYAEFDIVNYLDAIISDSKILDEEELEFRVRYKTYCHYYYYFKEILEICVAHINEQIAASQGQIAMFSNTLSSGEASVASYSVKGYTNSNYQNITDMDYYQNECIKQLVERVLELETRLNELTNNN